jgi:hypothetical protein
MGGMEIPGMSTPAREHAWPTSAPNYLPPPAMIGLDPLGQAKAAAIAADSAPDLSPTETRDTRIKQTQIEPGSSRIGGPAAEWLESGFERPEPLNRHQFYGPSASPERFNAPEPPQGPQGLPTRPTGPRPLPPAALGELPTARLSASQFGGVVEAAEGVLKL